MRPDWRQLSDAYQRLSSRERFLVSLAAGVALLVVLYLGAWQPLNARRAFLLRRIAAKERQLAELGKLRSRYLELRRELEAGRAVLARVDEKFSLFPHIEATAAAVVGREHIASMNPETKPVGDAYRQESVELKLTAVTLEQLVELMYRIEKGPQPLRVTRLQVKKRYKDPHTFDVRATVSLLKRVEG